MFLGLLEYDVLKKKKFYDRDKYHSVLADPDSGLGSNLRAFVSFCVFLGVGVILFETIPAVGNMLWLEFFLIDIFISFVFAIEYIYRFMRSGKKLDFSVNIFNIIDLLSFLPFFIGLAFNAFAGLDVFKVLRLLRVLRLFEVSSQSPLVLGFMRTIKEYRHEYKAIFSIFISMLIIISTFVYYCEFPVNATFSSIPQTLWWGIVTMTTVGYGDMAPITTGGKLFGTILILLGPVLVAVIGSITILVFMDVAEAQKENNSKMCVTCKTHNPESANFCYNCGHTHFAGEDSPIESLKKNLMEKIFSKKVR